MLKDKLMEFRNLTIKCINLCDNEDFNGLKDLIDKRQELIDSFSEFSYSSIEFKKNSQELNIVEYEKKLNKLMEEKKSKLKSQMNNVTNSKKAHNVYNKGFTNTAHFLEKRM